MKDFNTHIKEKINTYGEDLSPSNQKVSAFFEKLDAHSETPEVTLQREETQVIAITPINWVMRIAAAVVLLIAASFTLYQYNQVTIEVRNGLSQNITLPDGSEVAINAGSSIEYNTLKWLISRNIKLEGEAFFTVQKGETFTVTSDLGSTQVLGTSFNIFARDNQYDVKCHTGEVKVSSPLSDSDFILTPGKGVALTKAHEVDTFVFDKTTVKDWRSGEFFFENTTLKEVFNSLERQYNITVSLPTSVGRKKYTGYFNNKDLNKSLRLICDPINLHYTIDGNTVKVVAKK